MPAVFSKQLLEWAVKGVVLIATVTAAAVTANPIIALVALGVVVVAGVTYYFLRPRDKVSANTCSRKQSLRSTHRLVFTSCSLSSRQAQVSVSNNAVTVLSLHEASQLAQSVRQGAQVTEDRSDASQKEMDKLHEELSEERKRSGRLEQLLNAATKKMDTVASEVADLKREVRLNAEAGHKHEADKLRKELGKERQRSQLLERQLRVSTKKVEDLTKQVDGLQQEVRNLTNVVGQLMKQLQESNGNRACARTDDEASDSE